MDDMALIGNFPRPGLRTGWRFDPDPRFWHNDGVD